MKQELPGITTGHEAAESPPYADSEATRTQIPIHCGQHSDDCGQLMMTC